MGKSFTPLKVNGISFSIADKLINPKKVIETSDEMYFISKPHPSDIEDIEIGCDGTDETIVRLYDGDFIAYKGTVELV